MSVKRTFSFSDTNLELLEQLIPKSKRSRFVNMALANAIEQKTKELALSTLENFDRVPSFGKPVEDTLIELRQQESDRLAK